MSDNKPIDTVRHGNLKAAIWKNESERGMYLNVTISKTYKDENGEYQSTNILNESDLPRLGRLADRADDRCLELRREHAQDFDRDGEAERERSGPARDFDRSNGRERQRSRGPSR